MGVETVVDSVLGFVTEYIQRSHFYGKTVR